ncbi:MAG TPA: type III pantothenate kinase [Bacilli bacterium]|nr:type III pantothenate kinase [Bacilli bacterium]
MILTIDIGNTFICLALSKDGQVIERKELHTKRKASAFHYFKAVRTNLKLKYDKLAVRQVVIASVVPSLTAKFVSITMRLFNVVPHVLTAHSKLNTELEIDHPEEVGADIIAAAVAVKAQKRYPAIVVDLGTANKYIYINEHGNFAGVVISGGLMLSFDALTKKAEKLRDIPLEAPNKVLGKNTIDALSSGLFYRTQAEIKSFVQLIEKEVDKKCQVIVTGGSVPLIKKMLPKSYMINQDLIHQGLLVVGQLN